MTDHDTTTVDPQGPPAPEPPAYDATPATPAPGARTRPRLVRRSDDRMVAGVCSGMAHYLGVDVTIVRLLVVLGTVLGFGSLIIAYVAAWILLPEV